MKEKNGKETKVFDLKDAPKGSVKVEVTTRTKKSKDYLKYEFLREEREALGLELAQKHNELSRKEGDKKAVVKSFDSEIATIEAKTNEVATKLNNGHEYRDVEVEITFDYETRLKTYVRLDTGEKYKEVPMTSNELQVPLPIPEELPEEEKAEVGAE